MYSTATFLTRRKSSTVRGYKRALARFAVHVGFNIDTLHEYLQTSPKEKLVGDLLTFADSLKALGQNTQKNYVAAVMSYLGYNDIVLPKAQRSQIIVKRGDVFRDKAMTVEEVKKVYEYLSPIGRAILLLLFTTGVRMGELLQVKESDMKGKTIHLKGSYTKTGKERDIIMTTECHKFLTEIWLPQKQDYLNAAQNRNKGLANQTETPHKRAGVKRIKDDRIIPLQISTGYGMLMRAFRSAGFSEKEGKKNLYHPHGLRKSFRTIVGGKNIDLAEELMGHSGYMSQHYVRIDDKVKDFEAIEHLLTLAGNGNGVNNRVKALEAEKDELAAVIKQQGKEILELREMFKKVLDMHEAPAEVPIMTGVKRLGNG
jgi:integrase